MIKQIQVPSSPEQKLVDDSELYTKGIQLPTVAYLYFPKDAEIKTGEGKSGIRRIFDGQIVFDNFEKKILQEFKDYCVKMKLQLDSYWRDCILLRFLQANHFKFEKTLHTVNEHSKWRQIKLPPKITDQIFQYLNNGVIYIQGRDHRFRPIVVLNPYKIDVQNMDVDVMINSLTYLFEFITKHMFLPGQIENWVIIMDLNKMGLFSLPLGPLKEIMGYLSNNYRSRLYKMYIINTPSSIFIPWNLAKTMIEENTVKKINFAKNAQADTLFQHVNPNQIEKKFNGLQNNKTNQFWPPHVNPDSNHIFLPNEKIQDLLITEQLYYQMFQQNSLVNNALCSDIIHKFQLLEKQVAQHIVNDTPEQQQPNHIYNTNHDAIHHDLYSQLSLQCDIPQEDIDEQANVSQTYTDYQHIREKHTFTQIEIDQSEQQNAYSIIEQDNIDKIIKDDYYRNSQKNELNRVSTILNNSNETKQTKFTMQTNSVINWRSENQTTLGSQNEIIDKTRKK